MRIGEIIHADAKHADDYDEEDLFRLQGRLDIKIQDSKSVEAAALSIISEEVKTNELVPTMKESYKLLKVLLSHNNKKEQICQTIKTI